MHVLWAPILYDESSHIHPFVPLPDDLAEALLLDGVLRVHGSLNGTSFDRAVQGRAPGTYRLVFGKSFLRRAGVWFGDMVEVRLAPHPNPDIIELAPELQAALAEEPEAAARFATLSPGKQRSLNLHVADARQEETRQHRADDIARKLRTYTLYSDRRD